MKKLLNKLFNKPQEPVAQPVQVPSTSITLQQWQKNPDLVAASASLQKLPTFRLMMDCLRNSHPCHNVFAAIGVNPNDRIVHQAKIEGFEMCLNTIEAMAVPFKISKSLQETFEPAENSTKTK